MSGQYDDIIRLPHPDSKTSTDVPLASILALLRPSWMLLRIWSLWRFTLDPSSCITGILLWLAHQNQRFSSASASSTEVIFRIRRSLSLMQYAL